MKKSSKHSMNADDPSSLFEEALRLLTSNSGSLLDFWEGLELIRHLADQGYSEAQNELGGMYQNGLGVAKNYREAVK